MDVQTFRSFFTLYNHRQLSIFGCNNIRPPLPLLKVPLCPAGNGGSNANLSNKAANRI